MSLRQLISLIIKLAAAVSFKSIRKEASERLSPPHAEQQHAANNSDQIHPPRASLQTSLLPDSLILIRETL